MEQETLEKALEGCKSIKDKKDRSVCVWKVIYKTERFVDEARKELPLLNEKEALASKIIERNVDISREIAKGFKNKGFIDFGYINEKYEKLRSDIKFLQEELK